MVDLTKIDTEKQNLETINLDEMNALEIVKTMNAEDEKITKAIKKEEKDISKVVEIGGETLKNNGRIIYIGAGTSGRLGILDAVECPPTFGVDYNQVIGLIAGGDTAFIKAVEGAEDEKELAIKDLEKINLSHKDFVIGIAASGRTPYVIGGLEQAKEKGAKTASLAITKNSEIAKFADFKIEVDVGAEVLTGSTRLKAGTCQKMILNMISTGSMVMNGKVYQNLMVDVQQTNKKLVERARSIVIKATDCSYEVAQKKLEEADGNAKTAIMMILGNLDKEVAQKMLIQENGFIKNVLKKI